MKQWFLGAVVVVAVGCGGSEYPTGTGGGFGGGGGGVAGGFSVGASGGLQSMSVQLSRQ